MVYSLTVVVSFFAAQGLTIADHDEDNGMPYGAVTEEDVDRLNAFAKSRGIDLLAELVKAYESSDDDALSRVFAFSTQFHAFDENARAYGHLIYCSALNLGETWGIDRYARVVLRQSPRAQQRIRDFIVYTAEPLPEAELAVAMRSNKEDYPLLFPADYVWRKNNSLFAAETLESHPSPTGRNCRPRHVYRRGLLRRRCW